MFLWLWSPLPQCTFQLAPKGGHNDQFGWSFRTPCASRCVHVQENLLPFSLQKERQREVPQARRPAASLRAVPRAPRLESRREICRTLLGLEPWHSPAASSLSPQPRPARPTESLMEASVAPAPAKSSAHTTGSTLPHLPMVPSYTLKTPLPRHVIYSPRRGSTQALPPGEQPPPGQGVSHHHW